MTDKPKPTLAPVQVLNPRYAGATPEMVGKALLKHPPKPATRQKRKPPAARQAPRSVKYIIPISCTSRDAKAPAVPKPRC